MKDKTELAKVIPVSPLHKDAEWITIRVPKRGLESIKNLCHWLDGFEAAGHQPRVTGHHELIMFLRSMQIVKTGDDDQEPHPQGVEIAQASVGCEHKAP